MTYRPVDLRNVAYRNDLGVFFRLDECFLTAKSITTL